MCIGTKKWEIIYITTGKMILRLNDSVVEASSGDFIFITPETVHYIRAGNECWNSSQWFSASEFLTVHRTIFAITKLLSRLLLAE